MATEKAPKRRSSRSTQLSRHTRSAHEAAQQLLTCLSEHPALAVVREADEVRQCTETLRQDVATLSIAPKLRIGAARRLQGASSRRQTASQTLFEACTEVRRRVKIRYRGPRHAALRRSFGEGLPASPAKPETVLAFARHILSAAPQHEAALRQVRVGPPTIQRLSHLHDTLKDLRPERAELRVERRKVSQELVDIADRVNLRSHALVEVLRRLLPGADLSFLPALPKARVLPEA